MTGIEPLLERFPSLERLPRVSLRPGESPVERVIVAGQELWVKRDDLGCEGIGGNKVRSLEFLLGGAPAGSHVVTVGSVGSTHALATAIHARRLGLRAEVGLWRQFMNRTADRVSSRLAEVAHRRRVFTTPAGALAWGWAQRARGVRWIPAGGTSPLGMLGHVNAGLELARQVERGLLPAPARVVLPLGTGGTAAGLALGFHIAGLRTTVVGTRVVPRLVGRHRRVMRLANAAARLIEHQTGTRVPRVPDDAVTVVHSVYGRGYGIVTRPSVVAVQRFRHAGIPLDWTYTAKAGAYSLMADDQGPTLFWLTFGE